MTTQRASGLPIVLIAGAPRPSWASAVGDHPYAIAEAQTGALAVEWARDLHPDVSGIEACRLLRADLRIAPNVPILLLCTDEPSPGQRATALRAGAWGVL